MNYDINFPHCIVPTCIGTLAFVWMRSVGMSSSFFFCFCFAPVCLMTGLGGLKERNGSMSATQATDHYPATPGKDHAAVIRTTRNEHYVISTTWSGAPDLTTSTTGEPYILLSAARKTLKPAPIGSRNCTVCSLRLQYTLWWQRIYWVVQRQPTLKFGVTVKLA